MQSRIEEELAQLRESWPTLEYRDAGQWVLIPEFTLPERWEPTTTPVTFQIPPPYPGTPPYGFHTPSGIRFNGAMPANYKEPAPSQPPFPGGPWGQFSWQPDGWKPAASVGGGSNLYVWVRGFAQRFAEGH